MPYYLVSVSYDCDTFIFATVRTGYIFLVPGHLDTPIWASIRN